MDHGSEQQPLPTAGRAAKRKRLVPPRWYWFFLAVAAVAIALLHGTEIVGDRALANILTIVLTSLAVVMLWAWLSFSSGYARRWRMLVLAGGITAVAVFAAAFRVDHLSGELIPSFSYRWSPKADQGLQTPPAPGPLGDRRPSVQLSSTPDDFPQFLGPDRNAGVNTVRLARDWAGHPPQLVWRHEIGAGWSAFSVVHGYAVTMEQRGDLEMVTCYDVKTGQMCWAHSRPTRYEGLAGGVGPRCTPTIDAGLVYTLGAQGHLQCLDGATGACRWEKNLPELYHIAADDEAASLPYGRSNSPLVLNDLVVVPAGGPSGGPYVSLVAYDKHTGERRWEGGDRQISYSSPVSATLGGVRQILSVNEDNVSGHDPQTGRLLWQFPWEGRSSSSASVSQPVPVPPERVFLSKAYGRGAALVKLTPNADGTFRAEAIWENRRVMKTKFSNVALYEGFVYGLSDGILECVELATGRRVWREGRYHQGQILRVGDLLLVLTESGETLLVEASPDRVNQVLARFQALEGMCWNNIALYGSYLLVRNAQEAACYQLPLETR